MKKVRYNFIWILIALWVGVYQLYWQLSPHLADYNNPSFHTSIYLIVKGLTAIGPNLLLILLGYFISRSINRESFIIKGWLNTLGLGLLISVLVAMSSNKLNQVANFNTSFFDSLFPVIRNSYPLIFGALFGLLMYSVINNLDLAWQRKIKIGIWVLIAIPIFSYPNIWGWSNNFLVIFYSLLFLLGSQMGQCSNLRSTTFLGILAFGINVLLQGLIPIFSISGETILRYSDVTNVLTVLIAYLISTIIIKYIGEINWRVIFSFLVLIENKSLLIRLLLPLKLHNQHSSFKVGIYTVTWLLIVLLLAFLWSLCTKYLFFKKINESLTKFVEHPLSIQLQIVKEVFKDQFPNVLLGGVAYVLSATSMLLMNNGLNVSPNVDASYNIFAYTFVTRETLVIFAAVLIFLTAKFIQAITNRYWVSLILVSIINIVIVIANREKIAARNEPILPSDLLMVSVAKEIFGMVSHSVWILALIILAILVVLTIWLEHNYPIKTKWGIAKRILFILLGPLVFSTSLLWNHQGSIFSNLMVSIDDQPMFYNQLSGARINGPVIQFMNNIDVKVMAKPSGYSQTTMDRIVKEYDLRAKDINKTRDNKLEEQNVIFNLSESFANPQRVPGVTLRNNPIPYITKMIKENTGGLMISSGYGGGTANMEYMALTGFALSNFSPTLPTPYTQLVNNLKQDPSIVDSFKYAVAIHPYNGVFYNRIGVYHKFGFNKFLYLGSKYPIRHQKKIGRSPYLSDEASYRNVLDQLNGKRNGQFINLVTMQNHFPYDQHFYNNFKEYEAIKVSDGTNIDSVNDFTTGIHYTDEAMKRFIVSLDKIQKPITLVFYGDHLPGIYANNMEKDGIKLHETDYFVYSNSYAREHGAKNFHKDTKYISPNDFIAIVAKQTNSKVNWYQALLTDVYEKLPAIGEGLQSSSNVNTYNNGSEFINQDGKLVKEKSLTSKQKQILHDYRLVQYDITAGKHYLSKNMK